VRNAQHDRSAGFLWGAFASGSAQSATVGLRLLLPLYPSGHPHSWFGPYYRNT
jgi:hypothetical protein